MAQFEGAKDSQHKHDIFRHIQLPDEINASKPEITEEVMALKSTDGKNHMILRKPTQLSDVANIIMGQSPPSESINYVGDGLPFFQGRTEFGEVSPTPTRWCSIPPTLAESGDILISVRAPAGQTNLATIKCGIGRGLAAIRADQSKLDTTYLKFLLRKVEPDLARKAQDSPSATIIREDLASIRVPLPSLAEQCRDVDVLSRVEGIVQIRREAERKSAEMVAEIFLGMFGDPATNTMGWATVPLGSVGILARGKAHHRPLGLAQSNLWPAGTLCISIAGNIVKTGILEFEACFADSVIGFLPGESVQTEFVQTWLNLLQPKTETGTPQTAKKSINLKNLRNLSLSLPPLNLQLEFARKVEQIRFIQVEQANATAKAQEDFNALLAQIFSIDGSEYRS